MERFKILDRNQQLLLPYDLRDWVSEDDFVNFVIEAVSSIDVCNFAFNRRGTGSENYHPHVMLSLLIFCYANGVFSSRRIEKASYRDIAVRYILCNTHPDHSTISKFRKDNFEAISEAFLTVLRLAKELKMLKVGTISVDGTKIKASASKTRNVRYDRACELEEQLKLDIAELMKKAETADAENTKLDDSLPEEISRRTTLLQKITEAKKAIEERDKPRIEREKAEFEKKKKEREEKDTPPRGKKPKEPDTQTNPKLITNMTDEDSRVMKHNKTSELIQGYNAQGAVDADGSMLILATYVTTECNDKKQLERIATSVNPEIGTVTTVLADAGYGAEQGVEATEKKGVKVLVSVHSGGLENGRHYDFKPTEDCTNGKKPKRSKKEEKEWVTKMKEAMEEDENRELYRMRMQTVEPVWGIIKQAMGFRQFLTRGINNVSNEWNLVSTAYNFKRLFSMVSAK